MRCAEWFDVEGKPLQQGQVHDFAVIWDEDHDDRVISTIEELYMAGLLAPVQFIGERKGTLTVVVAARFYSYGAMTLEEYEKQVLHIGQTAAHQDCWGVDVGMFDRSTGSPHQTDPKHIVHADEEQVITYLRHIDALWKLGTKTFEPEEHCSGLDDETETQC